MSELLPLLAGRKCGSVEKEREGATVVIETIGFEIQKRNCSSFNFLTLQLANNNSNNGTNVITFWSQQRQLLNSSSANYANRATASIHVSEPFVVVAVVVVSARYLSESKRRKRESFFLPAKLLQIGHN